LLRHRVLEDCGTDRSATGDGAGDKKDWICRHGTDSRLTLI
jgi:hypothetical protein